MTDPTVLEQLGAARADTLQTLRGHAATRRRATESYSGWREAIRHAHKLGVSTSAIAEAAEVSTVRICEIVRAA